MLGVKNVFENIGPSDKEIIEKLIEKENIRIERIASFSDRSENGFYYDQDEYEFVLLLKGRAKLLFEGRGTVELKAGDWLVIEPHERHRVEYTSKDALWLCVFYR